MKNSRWAVIFLLCPIFVITTGCVAQKKSGVQHTLKGDNSMTAPLTGAIDLPDSGFISLADVTDRFSRDLAREVQGRKIYLDRANIRDINTNDVANFSSYLENELEASLSKTFQLVYDPSEADYLIGAVFQKYGNMVRIFFKYHNPDVSVRKSLDYSIERVRLPNDSLKENIRSKAYKLSANIINDQEELKIYIKPIREGTHKYETGFSTSFTTLVKNEIVRMHRIVQIIDEKPAAEKLGNVRGVSKKAKEVKRLETSDAFFADADSVLEGTYFKNGETVTVTLFLKDLQGHVLNSATVDIDMSLIKTSLTNKTAKDLSDLAGRASEMGSSEVKISTTKGSDYPVYHEAEKIIFYIQVARPLYVYIYDLDSKGNVELLYPYTTDSPQSMLYPGRLYTIPSEQDNFDMTVNAPFGMDAVKIFASPIQLPLPQLSRRVATRSYRGGTRAIRTERKNVQTELAALTSINPKDLVDYYRGLADRFQENVYEDSVLLETRK